MDPGRARAEGAEEVTPWPARASAHVAAWELVQLAQSSPEPAEVHRLLRTAKAHGWHEVVLVLNYALLAASQPVGEDISAQLAEMFVAAEAADDAALRALCLATRAERSAHSPNLVAAEEAALARAVALLDEEGGSPVDRPAAYIACALAYQARELWELEEEMYVRASHELSTRLPAPFDQAQELISRTVLTNRIEAHSAWACALMELGDRDGARQRAKQANDLDPAERERLPQQWRWDLWAVDYLLSAIASDPEPLPFRQVMACLDGSFWPGYRSCTMLGLAIRRLDAGDAAGCAELAEQALPALDRYIRPSIRALALQLATVAESAPATLRRAEELSRLRWQARVRQLSSARVRLDAERVMLENDRLAQRAYVDELTGLANRHAYARQVKRLRHGPAQDDVAVLMIDVDHFKRVNDQFGHTIGDEVLRRLGGLLAEHSRAGDLVARMGGDEFVVILDLTRQVDVTARGQGLVRDVADHPWNELAPELTVTVSAGLARGACCDVDDLLTAADQHLYQAKSCGRGRLVADSPSEPIGDGAGARSGTGFATGFGTGAGSDDRAPSMPTGAG
jgi:diguanylate cyclase (GGDEF)-like protein